MTDELETLPELDPGASDLLGAYAEQTARGSVEVEAALSRVVGQVSAPGPGAAAGGLSTTAKILIATAVLGVGAWAATGLQSPEARSERPTVAVARPSPDELPPEPRIEAPSVNEPAPKVDDSIAEVPSEPTSSDESSPATEPRPTKPRRPRAAKAVEAVEAVEAEPRASLVEELRLLKQVRTDLRAGRGAKALEGAREHRRLYPSSTLAEERDATEVMALCTLGRDSEARADAAAFTRRYPTSQRDVLAACDR